MFELPEESIVERTLHDGLVAVPVREPSIEFDARIMESLRPRTPWRTRLWKALWPALPAAACSALAMAALLRWTETTPMAPLSEHGAERSVPAIHPTTVDTVIEEGDLTRMNLSLLIVPQAPPPPVIVPPRSRHIDRAPRHSPIGPHAQSSIRPFA